MINRPGCLIFFTALTCLCCLSARSQTWPDMMHISDDGRRLITGDYPVNEFYDLSQIKTIELWFEQEDWWDQLEANYETNEDIPATMIYDGDTLLTDIGVRFKGQTSYFMNMSDKKSFNLTLDYIDTTQDIHGYNTLNLNCAFEDPSFMRESIYENTIQKYIPGLAVNYVTLYLNGEYWGLYLNVQQLNKDFLKEWFLTNDGTNWRAERNDGGGMGDPGGAFGTGYCSMNYLGDDTSDYTSFYTLKSTTKENPWEDLVRTCDVLNNNSIVTLEDSVSNYLDLDRTLWFLACETIFADDDSYIHKGGMDYYLYWEKETGRMVPLEFDGNSCMRDFHAFWSPFYHETNVAYPLMNRLFDVNSIRQRYLAHVRTILSETFNSTVMDSRIDDYAGLIDSIVQGDPKKIYTYLSFLNDVDELKEFVADRYEHYMNHPEVGAESLIIDSVKLISGGIEWGIPPAFSDVEITAYIPGTSVQYVNLYYATGVVGRFMVVGMFDDGIHNDGGPGDGIFGASIPGYAEDTEVRFYVEAAKTDPAATRTYYPAGAEHDVYYYKVGEATTAISQHDGETIRIYPNPAFDQITIDPASPGQTVISIYNISGLKIAESKTAGSITLNVTHWPAGTYLLRMNGLSKLFVIG